ncbi:MAG TPA: glycosyltransferase [Acidimicrobiales bacterium]|nr:glycosyltransferase [Acidimicrobiales bacterium]
MPRVLTVLTFYDPHWTGLTVFARRIAEGLAADGCDVTVVCSHHDPQTSRRDERNGVAIVRVPTAGRLSRTLLMPALPLVLHRLVPHHDVVHLHSPMAEAELVAATCRRHRVPLVVTHQGDVVMPDTPAEQLVQRLMRATLRRTFQQAARVVTHNDDYAAHASPAVAGTRALAIDPPVVFDPPEPGATDELRSELGLGDRPVVAFAGRWVEEKGFDVLLRAAPKVLAARPDVAFVFAGETSVTYEGFRERCQPLADPLGPALIELGLILDQRRLAAFYAMADVFVLPSRSDCHASVQIEAMLCGTPVVASDIVGARSIVGRTGAGLLVPPEDPDALAAGITEVLLDPGRFAGALAAVPSLFPPADGILRYRALMDEVIAEHTAGLPLRPEPAVPSAGPGGTVARLVATDLDPAYRRRTRWLLERVARTPGARVLDAGSGLGTALHLLGQALPDAVAIGTDVDLQRHVDGRRSGVDAPVTAADLAALPHADEVFDVVLCSEVLEHVADDAAALAELHRVLRPGGRLLVSVPHADFPAAWDPPNRLLAWIGLPLIRRGILAGAWTDHQRLYRPDELLRSLRAAGFVVDEVEEQTHRCLPFTHLLVYGVALRISRAGLVPLTWERDLGRYRSAGPAAAAARADERPSLGLRLAQVLRRRVDRDDLANGWVPPGTRRFVSIVAAAHRPDGSR